MKLLRKTVRPRRSFNRVFFAASSVCEALEPRQLLSAVTMFPTDGSTSSPQVQCSEERELVVTLATAESGFNAGDLTLSLLNSNGSGGNNGSASTTLSGVLGTPTNPSGDDVAWIVPIVASTSYTTSTGSLDNGIYTLSVNNSGTSGVSQFFRLYGSLDGQLRLSEADTTSFENADGASTGAPGYQPDLDDTGSGSINNTDARRYSAADALAFTTSAAAYPTDGLTNSPQVQRSEERELVVTLGTAEALTAGDLSLFLANGDGSGANNNSASTNISSVLGTPANPSGDGVTWIVPIAASTSYTTSTGSLDNGIYELSVSDSSTPPASFFRLFGSVDGSEQLSSTDSTDFSDADGTSSGDPGFQPDLDDTGSGTINNTDARRFSIAYGLTFAAPVASASASASTVTGTTVGLTGAASGSTYSSGDLIYDWTVLSAPSGAPAPTFSANGSNAAASSTATFGAASAYAFQVTVTDPSGQSSTSSVDVAVDQTLTSISVTPGTAALGSESTQQFAATALDQFGDALASQPAFTWSNSGAGSVSSSGLYTAAASLGSDTVTAASGSISGSAAVTISAPAAPTALTSAVSGGDVTLSWNGPSEPVNTFNVYASTNGGTTFTLFDSVDGGQTSDSLAGLSPDTSYVFEVTAVQGAAESAASNTTSLTSPALPEAPSGLTASVSGGSVTLSWTGDPTNLATSYNVYASTDGGAAFTQIDSVDASQTCDSLSGLTPNAAYVFQVTAVDASGETAPSNATAALTSPAIPGSPAGLSASVSGGTVALNWAADSTALATSYNVYASTDGGTTFNLIDSVDASQTSDSLYGLAPDTSYIFQVTSVDASGESAPSNNTDALTSPALPATPSGLTATMSAGDAVLNWTGDATLSTGYNIYDSTDGGNNFSYLDSTAAGTTTYTATPDELTAGTAYVFQVTAVDASGETPASNNADFTAPAAPTNVAATLSSDATSATVNWEPGDSVANGYIITRTPDDGSSGTVTVATLSGNATSLYTDTGLDPTQAYTYAVTPYYTATAPSAGDPTGTGVSASADTYTGNIEDFTVASSSGSGTVNLTWLYQGSDSFEIEEHDTGAAGTNYATVGTVGGRTWEASGLMVGDTYNFRIRADHSDGTASDYSTQSITLPGPSATITAVNDTSSAGPAITIDYSAAPSASGAAVTYYNVQWYDNAAPGTGWAGFELFSGDTSEQEVGVQPLETASFRVQAVYADGTLSQWSPTATATSGYGSDPAADPSTVTPVTVSATAASDTSVTLTYGATLPGYAIGTATGTYTVAYAPDSDICGAGATTQVQTLQSFSASSGGGSTTITGLTPGVKYDFVVTVAWTTYGGDSDESAGGGFGGATATTTGTVAPAAPAAISAALDPTVAGQVDIYWQNTSNNETGFQLLQSLDGGGTWDDDGGPLAADQTSTTDTLSSTALSALASGTLEYEVLAYNGPAASQPSPASQPATDTLAITSVTPTKNVGGNQLIAVQGQDVTVTAQLKDPAGKPIPKQQVTLSGDAQQADATSIGKDGMTATTDKDGNATFTFHTYEPAANMGLDASTQTATSKLVLVSIDPVDVDIATNPIPVLSVDGAPKTATVKVTTKNKTTGDPAPGIYVVLSDRKALVGSKGQRTGADGTATIEITALQPGNDDLVAQVVSLGGINSTAKIPESTKVNVSVLK